MESVVVMREKMYGNEINVENRRKALEECFDVYDADIIPGGLQDLFSPTENTDTTRAVVGGTAFAVLYDRNGDPKCAPTVATPHRLRKNVTVGILGSTIFCGLTRDQTPRGLTEEEIDILGSHLAVASGTRSDGSDRVWALVIDADSLD